MTYYLQQHQPDGRWIIDLTFPWNAHRVADSREASTWLEAKRAFGYTLSDVQLRLLAKQHADADVCISEFD